MKLSTGLENFKGVVSDDLSFVSVEMVDSTLVEKFVSQVVM